jgi:dTDP-4-dehydrorhamnose 3,5-epimerase
MQIIRTEIPDVVIIEPKVFGDPRGFFLEAFQSQRYAEAGIKRPFLQDNLSRSAYGVLRGLHIQNPRAQGKLVTVVRGSVLDVAVDVRIGSPTFARHVSVELNEDNRRQLWVPRGFAHGFVTLSDTADFFYKCDEYYSPADESVIRWNDPVLGIKWGVKDPTISARDGAGRYLGEMTSLPRYGGNESADSTDWHDGTGWGGPSRAAG